MSTMSQYSRLFYMASELRPTLPPASLLRLLGSTWGPLVDAAAKYGLGGIPTVVADADLDQLRVMHKQGKSLTEVTDIAEFRASMVGVLHAQICGNGSLSILDQVKLGGELYSWFQGEESNHEQVLDFDAEVETPMFTHTGLWPLDRILGDGVPQDITTIIARPECGKSTLALAGGFNWRRANIGSVTLMQTEMTPAAMALKVKGMTVPGENLWRSGVDKIVYGKASCWRELQENIKNPDPDRLLIWDSVSGFCGDGSTPDSRTKYYDLYAALMDANHSNRAVLACTHAKRGIEEQAHIEAAAGSASVERYSGALIYLDKSPQPRPDGRQVMRFQSLKNRYGVHVDTFAFAMDFVRGIPYEVTDVDFNKVMESLEDYE